MKQLFSKLIELVAKNDESTVQQHRELVPIRVSARSPLESQARRAAHSRTTGQGWRVTSFSGF
jgi:hypothetical protein